MRKRLLTLCILVVFLAASVPFMIKPANAISPGQTQDYYVSANDDYGVVSASATLSYYTSGSDQYVRMDLGWASVFWYPSVTHVQFQIGLEFTITETNDPAYESHVSLPWHTGLQWDWFGIPTWGEGSCIADTNTLPINYNANYYFIAKRVNYQNTECWTELNAFIYTGGPQKDGDEDFISLSLPTAPPPPPSGGGGGGGGCVLQGTQILMADGKTMPVQAVKPGDKITGYDVSTGAMITETVTSNEHTLVDEILVINQGLLSVTPMDQPIYTDHGWVGNPQDLRVGDKIYKPATQEWITIFSIDRLVGHFTVFDVRATGTDTFIGNGILLDMKAMMT